MRIEICTGGFTQTNGYLVEAPDGTWILFDAPEGAAEWLEERGIRLGHLVLTHQHFDHVMDAAAIREAGAVVHAWAPHSASLTLVEAFGLPMRVEEFEVDRLLEGQENLEIGGLVFEMAHVPGHSPDSVTFHHRDSAAVICGDTVFAGSIGRTDLPGGSHEQLIEGIRRHLLSLPPSTRLFPGHGPATTVEAEARGNPYLI
jgi:glyoxylase-like metal-dependent hydrolase (beta-lactamase superfamily II)